MSHHTPSQYATFHPVLLMRAASPHQSDPRAHRSALLPWPAGSTTLGPCCCTRWFTRCPPRCARWPVRIPTQTIHLLRWTVRLPAPASCSGCGGCWTPGSTAPHQTTTTTHPPAPHPARQLSPALGLSWQTLAVRLCQSRQRMCTHIRRLCMHHLLHRWPRDVWLVRGMGSQAAMGMCLCPCLFKLRHAAGE